MSGSGSFSSNSTSKFYACERLKFYTHIRSPNPLLAKKIKIGDILMVDLIEDSICAIFGGDIVGGITSEHYQNLFKCITGGTIYQASVCELNHGQIKVFVYSV
ncbi:hypothetical protein FJU30_09415 [Affinibrenneria salicis]|uniref:Uncharacterized protein n=1 Tax=Affinibrenneria salicis TaxID=2590031 RepID=A0A5J5G1M8_9GAMM|nr:hypothetical protein [Affinibrenneria salicis]KAA9000459.1 hypothetical protein FJU30_09415 [Affinibrenneria salicis]